MESAIVQYDEVDMGIYRQTHGFTVAVDSCVDADALKEYVTANSPIDPQGYAPGGIMHRE